MCRDRPLGDARRTRSEHQDRAPVASALRALCWRASAASAGPATWLDVMDGRSGSDVAAASGLQKKDPLDDKMH